jgi:hypothetical protein
MRIRKSAATVRTVAQQTSAADEMPRISEGSPTAQERPRVAMHSPPSSVERTIATGSASVELPPPPDPGSPEVSMSENTDGHLSQALLDPPRHVSSSRLYIDELLSQPQNQHSPVRTNDKSLFTVSFGANPGHEFGASQKLILSDADTRIG